MAAHDRVSLNTFLVEAVAAKTQANDMAKRLLLRIETLLAKTQPANQVTNQIYVTLGDVAATSKMTIPDNGWEIPHITEKVQ